MRKISKAVRQPRGESRAAVASHALCVKVLGVEASFQTNSAIMAGLVMAGVLICMAGLVWGMGANANPRQSAVPQQHVGEVVEASASKPLIEEARYVIRR